jgi:hypothetical protein
LGINGASLRHGTVLVFEQKISREDDAIEPHDRWLEANIRVI